MRHKLRRLALHTIAASPLEPLARRAYASLVPGKGNAYDRQTAALLRRVLKPDSNAVDAGAYRGEVLRAVLAVAPRGRHFAFEPVPENYRYLLEHFPGVRVFDIALSDESGETAFQHVVGRPARSGLRRVHYPDAHQEVAQIRVKVDTLDRVIPEATPVHFLKIDVEGAELGVLRGARGLIARWRPVVVFEHGLDTAGFYGTTPEQIYDLLAGELGMQLSLMQRLLDGESGLARDAFVRHVRDGLDFYFVAYPPGSSAR